MLLRATLNTNQPHPLSPTPSSFIVQNKTGDTVAYINSTGGMYIVGNFVENVVFD